MQINVLDYVTAIYNRQSLFKCISIIQRYINELLDHQYGQINISNNSTTLAVTAAVDPTLATNSDYDQVIGIWDAIPHGFNNGVTQQASSFTMARKGVYRIAMWSSVTTSVNNSNVAFKFAVNGVINLQRRPRAFIGSANDRKNVSAHGFAELNAGDVITLWVACDKTANVLIEDCVFSVNEMRSLV